jgi:hypothetical protein
MNETVRSRRPTKASLGRIKLLAVILSFVAFIGSLAGVAIANPATANRSAPAVQPVAVDRALGIQRQFNSGSLAIPSQPQLPRVRPMTRSRGS